MFPFLLPLIYIFTFLLLYYFFTHSSPATSAFTASFENLKSIITAYTLPVIAAISTTASSTSNVAASTASMPWDGTPTLGINNNPTQNSSNNNVIASTTLMPWMQIQLILLMLLLQL